MGMPTVLVTEDDTKLGRLLQRALEEEGYAVTLCRTGDDAVRAAKSGDCDLVLLDWMLPGLDGLSVCRIIRGGNAKVGVVMLTARGQTEERIAAFEAGADAFMVKPFDLGEMLARVRAVLRRVSWATAV